MNDKISVAMRSVSGKIFGYQRSLWRLAVLGALPFLLAAAAFFEAHQILVILAFLFPFVFVLVAITGQDSKLVGADPLTGLPNRTHVLVELERCLRISNRLGHEAGAMLIEVDRFKLLEECHDRAGIEEILLNCTNRLKEAVRGNDVLARLDGPTFAIVLAPARTLDLEAAIQMAGRIQRALSEPVQIGMANVYLTASIGFALVHRIENPTGDTLLQAANSALIEAQRSGPGAIRSYSLAMQTRIAARNGLAFEVTGALERGEIYAFYQPQISTRTGEISGFETLARWHHPERGMIPPVEFLPALEQSGQMNRLSEIMVTQALEALVAWDEAGHHIPRIGVNFSSRELSDPRLVDRIGWELDRFDIAPERLVVEVLETVVAGKSDDMVIRNLSGLARLGCCLDLDDFGTGHASITSIRRFSIERIKIDRSFVTHIDLDPEQQKMVGAILTMAERLGLTTLAEGVETPEEQEMLGQIGCDHIQGFGFARPMPMSETIPWIRKYESRDSTPINLSQRASQG
ncbi:MAG: bifunctional diguanylate cyclase/phosphodiesterase [Rhodobacteraceae bacterium]|nr:bifunctional diguanylate cyclase/phosphodiesterase [Paracoccaceae bacterium]